MNAFINTSAASRVPHGTRSRFTRIGAPVVRFSRWLRDSSRRSAVMNELDRLSDRELADIGLSRGEIGSVFTMPRHNGR
jgi:uncharacterized protein YjiS (DUF1127 family)